MSLTGVLPRNWASRTEQSYLVELGCRRSVDDEYFFLLLLDPLGSMWWSRRVRLVQELRQMVVYREAYQMRVVDQMRCGAGHRSARRNEH